jgi:hypothetical protein
MDDIWKNAARKARARDKRAARPIANTAVNTSTTTTTTTTTSLAAATDNPATSSALTEEDMNTVEKVDAKLARMEEYWAESRSEPFPEGVRNAIAALRASLEEQDTETTPTSELSDLAVDVRHVTTTTTTTMNLESNPDSDDVIVEQHDAEPCNSGQKISESDGKEITVTRRIEREQIAGRVSAKEGENEEKREIESEEVEGRSDEGIRSTDEVHTVIQAANDGTTHQQQPTFDWATDIDQSIGPVPSVTDFRPTTPPQTVRTLPAPTDCKPAAYTPTTPALVNPDPGDTACAPSLHDVAPASTAPTNPTPVQSMHMSVVPTDPGPVLPKPTLVNPEPAPRHSVQASFIPVDPAPVDAPSVPTTSVHVSTSPAVRTNPIASTMPAARAPRDLSGLKSGARNPWSNLSRRRSYIHPPRDLLSLRSSTLNPWSSLRHRNHRSHPSHSHQYSDSEPLRHSHSNPLHPEPARLPTYPESHFPVQSPIEPVQLFQIIQHPRGISLNKPKISKTVSPIPAKFQKISCTARCACGNIIPTYNPDRRSWRRMDISRRRFEGGFDSRFRRRFSRRFSRRFCDW